MWSLCSFPKQPPSVTGFRPWVSIVAVSVTTALVADGCVTLLVAAHRKWLSRFESLRQDDAHRRYDGDAVRRAVCSAARTGASGALDRAKNGLRQKASVHGLVNEMWEALVPTGTQTPAERSGVLLGSADLSQWTFPSEKKETLGGTRGGIGLSAAAPSSK